MRSDKRRQRIEEDPPAVSMLAELMDGLRSGHKQFTRETRKLMVKATSEERSEFEQQRATVA
jgi:hypothetical protein